MPTPTTEQRAQFERDRDAVRRFVAMGLTPLIAAAANGQATNVPAALYLRQHPATRTALEQAMRDLANGIERAQRAWDAGQYDAAVRLAAVARNGAVELYRTTARAIPQADRILGGLLTDLATAPLEGLGFGAGLAVVVGLGLLLIAMKD